MSAAGDDERDDVPPEESRDDVPEPLEPPEPWERSGDDGAMPAERVSVGRDGASDAASFRSAGIPAVEFGPRGGGHHGPDEWVSIASLAAYREALVDFVGLVPDVAGEPRLRIA